jgi:hypothetical protein
MANRAAVSHLKRRRALLGRRGRLWVPESRF